ncbi:LOW QUALITY PROTEIN: hypothetical protein RJ639_037776 [Escallonia herrerae]|uniref:Thionin-like protein 2 n=1 Tax=Escallonia herrerae TaxID=1293975 RepID=A0AA88WK44_9ASTE|nr:LOW QUALITY PROTEIN: hypothetical protein RJ639_037776 [Escallonia herrerae]
MKGNNPALPDPKKLLPCAWKCLKQCTIDKPPLDLTASIQYYCNLGCMLDFCADVTNGYKVAMFVGGSCGTGDACGSTATFKDCCAKCFIFCMIEPDHTLCSCTTSCLKECIFPTATPKTSTHEENLGFCKLGCASSLCSKVSTNQNPKGVHVENCVGSAPRSVPRATHLPLSP